MADKEILHKIFETALRDGKSNISRAENRFDRSGELIDIEAKSEISLSSDWFSRVRNIANLSKDACDSLFVCYQSAIQTIDGELYHLVDDSNIPVTDIVEVYRFIRHCNEESKISNNYTASFNGTDLGPLASVSYFPFKECIEIEQKWQALCEKLQIEAVIKNGPDIKKQEEVHKYLDDNDEELKLRSEYLKALEDYKAREVKINNKLSELTDCYITSELLEENKAYIPLRKQLDRNLSELRNRRAEIEEELSSLGIFKMKEKKELRTKLLEADREVSLLTDKINEIEEAHHIKIREAVKKSASVKETLVIEAKKQVPGPDLPVEPEKLVKRRAQIKADFYKSLLGKRADDIEKLIKYLYSTEKGASASYVMENTGIDLRAPGMSVLLRTLENDSILYRWYKGSTLIASLNEEFRNSIDIDSFSFSKDYLVRLEEKHYTDIAKSYERLNRIMELMKDGISRTVTEIHDICGEGMISDTNRLVTTLVNLGRLMKLDYEVRTQYRII